jgi:hypothetical protein
MKATLGKTPQEILDKSSRAYPKDFRQLISGFTAYGFCVMLHIGIFLFGYAGLGRKGLLCHFVQHPVKAEGVSGRFFSSILPLPIHFRYGHGFSSLKNRQGGAKIFFQKFKVFIGNLPPQGKLNRGLFHDCQHI